MKIIQSFWSGNQKEFTNSYGWYSYKHNWISWILSCHQLVKYHDEVELYTDSFGYEILIEKLKLPYTKVHVVLDELNHHNKNLWAIAKVRTFQLQTAPFIHVDGDVFVWESLTDKFINSNLVTQNLEIATDYYRKRWDVIYPQLTFLPDEMGDYHDGRSNFACNMGIIGGTNLDFFKDYTRKSIEFVEKNKFNSDGIDALNFNIFFEQVLFKEFANVTNQNIDYLFSEVSLDNDYKGFGDFDKVPLKTYLHLLGVYKRSPTVCKAMEVYVMKYYPEQYSMLAKVINEENKDFQEIDFLDTKKVAELVTKFELELKSLNFKPKHFLLKRDLYNENLPNKLDTFLSKNQDFWIAKLTGFEKKDINIDNESFESLEISEINHIPRMYDLDEIDEIIVSELSKPIRYFNFIEKIATYFDDEEDEESKSEFLSLINNRLRNYLIIKIISIYSI
ncbi:DUF6734 family protein [Flavobacterium psychrotolerans]|uniref:DUF6734 domain-containing protein n=1 Tax=Flavobacterium psychrotolerans TaxID=2169410 RepID=A0A2U1JJR3_9FLAO|nr:DUF6734 family protein [Flavobacterium psychrotolerans]PWA05410.1 hypothetical protein DB895_07385 [Flavobacterium psychrotolerans]